MYRKEEKKCYVCARVCTGLSKQTSIRSKWFHPKWTRWYEFAMSVHHPIFTRVQANRNNNPRMICILCSINDKQHDYVLRSPALFPLAHCSIAYITYLNANNFVNGRQVIISSSRIMSIVHMRAVNGEVKFREARKEIALRWKCEVNGEEEN